jgi:hypothetical protein
MWDYAAYALCTSNVDLAVDFPKVSEGMRTFSACLEGSGHVQIASHQKVLDCFYAPVVQWCLLNFCSPTTVNSKQAPLGLAFQCLSVTLYFEKCL